MERWIELQKAADFQGWARRFLVDPLIARIIRNRDLKTIEEAEEFLTGDLKDIPSPFLLKNMQRAVLLLQESLDKGEYIRIIGDYDVDGICSSYILKSTLVKLGAKVDVAIPHRIHDGYGVNEHMIEKAREDGVQVILTCDNGISAMEPVKKAKEYGMKVIITDHHEVPREVESNRQILPGADVIINPKQEEETYPFTGICGAVVAYKYMDALLLSRESSMREQIMKECLVFAALATVCDVMELKKENRIFVREGLKEMAVTKNIGIRSLIQVCKLNPGAITAYHLGFVIGPCLNSTGRLDHATRALQLLECEELSLAVAYATELKEMNESRKGLTTKGVEAAIRLLGEKAQDKVLVVYLPEVHESLAGIIAGRIKEKYYRPTFVLTNGEEGVKGSGRSIEGYSMFEEMNKVKELFTKFGGHPMAAGCLLPKENVEPLREALNRNCSLTPEELTPKVRFEAKMPLEYATLPLAKQMKVLEPFGVGNPQPMFAKDNVIFIGANYLGKEGQYLKFTVQTEQGQREMVYFGDKEDFSSYFREKYGTEALTKLFARRGEYPMDVVYQIGVNEYHGRESLQFLMKYYR